MKSTRPVDYALIRYDIHNPMDVNCMVTMTWTVCHTSLLVRSLLLLLTCCGCDRAAQCLCGDCRLLSLLWNWLSDCLSSLFLLLLQLHLLLYLLLLVLLYHGSQGGGADTHRLSLDALAHCQTLLVLQSSGHL
jgi:hypothetical protein